MSQHKGKGGKTANPLQKPWTKDAAAKKPANRTQRAASVKAPQANIHAGKPVRAALDNESKVYGENACRVLFTQRPESVIRLYVSQLMAAKFADIMKYLASAKKVYHIVDDTELEKVASSGHHGGVVLLVKRKPLQNLATYLQKKDRKQDCLLALDGVGNPHKRGNTISAFC